MESSTKNALFIVGVVLASIVVAFVALILGALVITSPTEEQEEQLVSINFYLDKNSTDVFPLSAEVGDKITLPTAEICGFEKEGYTLKNWVFEEDGEETFYNPGQKVTLTENLSFYAVWELNETTNPDDPGETFKITFYKNNALDEVFAEYNKAEGSKFELPSVTETQNGMQFKKWMRIYSEEEEVAYLPETEITITENIDFYAVWVDPINPGYDEEIYSDGDNVLYKLSQDKSYAILLDATKLGKDSYEILDRFYQLPVEVIETNAFKNMNIKELTIPENIKEIKDEAFFGCDDLATVYFNANIGNFSGDKNEGSPLFKYYNPDNEHESFVSPITNLIIGENVKYLPPEAFMYLKIKSITIPASVERIFYSAFAGCEELETVIFEENSNLVQIDNDVFEDCVKLQSITIPSLVTTIGSGVFWDCTSLVEVNLPNAITSIGNYAFDGCTSLVSINLPDYLQTVESCLFRGCESLQSITIPSLVTKIDSDAFQGCTSLKSVVISNSVKSIGDNAFSGCTELTSINLPSSITNIGHDAFSRCESLTSINLPNSLETIESDLFDGCISLRSINLPDSITKIGYSAFENCSSLESVRFPDTLTIIDDSAFENCSSLTNIIIPESVQYIEQAAFNRSGLKRVTIYDSILEIDDFAFAGCTELEYINIVHSENASENILIRNNILRGSTGTVKFLGLTRNIRYRALADSNLGYETLTYHNIEVKSEYLDEYCDMWDLSEVRYSYITKIQEEYIPNPETGEDEVVQVTYYYNAATDNWTKTPVLFEHTEENVNNIIYWSYSRLVWYGFYNISTY